jgi:hypothetical protein
MALEIQKQRINLGPGSPLPGIKPRVVQESVTFSHPLSNNANTWMAALNGFHLEYTGTNDLSVLKHEVNVEEVTLDPTDPSNHTLRVKIAFLLADDAGTAPFRGFADVNILAQV